MSYHFSPIFCPFPSMMTSWIAFSQRISHGILICRIFWVQIGGRGIRLRPPPALYSTAGEPRGHGPLHNHKHGGGNYHLALPMKKILMRYDISFFTKKVFNRCKATFHPYKSIFLQYDNYFFNFLRLFLDKPNVFSIRQKFYSIRQKFSSKRKTFCFVWLKFGLNFFLPTSSP